MRNRPGFERMLVRIVDLLLEITEWSGVFDRRTSRACTCVGCTLSDRARLGAFSALCMAGVWPQDLTTSVVIRVIRSLMSTRMFLQPRHIQKIHGCCYLGLDREPWPSVQRARYQVFGAWTKGSTAVERGSELAKRDKARG